MAPPEPPQRGGGRITAVAWALNLLGVIIAGWAFIEFDPFPTSLVACLAAPLVAVGLSAAYPDFFALIGGRARGPRGLGALFLAPLGGLIFRAAFTVELLHFSDDLIPAVIGGVVGAAGFGLWWLRFRGNWRLGPFMAAIGVVVGCAVFEEIDTRFDHSPPQNFKVPVTDQFSTHRRTTSYYVSLPAWGPKHEADAVRVSSEVYNGIAPGQDVCVVLHPGYLGAAWYFVQLCPKPPAPS